MAVTFLIVFKMNYLNKMKPQANDLLWLMISDTRLCKKTGKMLTQTMHGPEMP